jgi:hypothetical protein
MHCGNRPGGNSASRGGKYRDAANAEPASAARFKS